VFYRAVVASLLLAVVSTGSASAHEIRPAYLSIAAISGGEVEQTSYRYQLLLRVPTGAPIPLIIDPVFPDDCAAMTEPRQWQQGRTLASRWALECSQSLESRTVVMSGLESAITDVLVRYERADQTTQIIRLTPTETSFVLAATESSAEIASTYLVLGIEHILLGIDHLLFVLALLLIVDGWRKLVATITAFTIAHSITLAAAALSLVSLPQAPVEAVIALSILFVCMEIVHWREGRPGMTREYPWLVALVFGLLHGFGFAGALAEIGLPQNAVPVALLLFNVGVEAGQLLFVVSVLLLWQLLKRIQFPDWAWRVPVYGIGSLAGFWTIERIASFI